MGQLSRRALLARAGAGAGAVALFGASATPVFAAAGEADLANVRIVCVAKRIAINWQTSWVNSPRALDTSKTADLVRSMRSQEQEHYGLLAPLLNGTAPIDDDYTFVFPAGALRSFDRAAAFALDLEELLLGIAIGAASRTNDPAVAEVLVRVVAGDGEHFAALSVLANGPALPNGAPRALGIEDGGNQLSQFLSY